MVFWVVHQQNVDAIEAEAFEALLMRGHDPVVAEIPNRAGVGNVLVERLAVVLLALIERCVGAQEPADLGRHDRA
jgi:hypothetical protein